MDLGATSIHEHLSTQQIRKIENILSADSFVLENWIFLKDDFLKNVGDQIDVNNHHVAARNIVSTVRLTLQKWSSREYPATLNECIDIFLRNGYKRVAEMLQDKILDILVQKSPSVLIPQKTKIQVDSGDAASTLTRTIIETTQNMQAISSTSSPHIQEGCEDYYMEFRRIDPSFRNTLHTITLKYINANIQDLENNLQGCLQLQILCLEEVELSGKFKKRIYLPNLQTFKLIVAGTRAYFSESRDILARSLIRQDEIVESESREQSNRPNPNICEPTRFDLDVKAMLFFDIIDGQSWELSDLFELKMIIYLKVGGWVFVEIDPKTKTFASRLDCSNSLLANNVYNDFDHFALRGINLEKLYFSGTLISLNIGYTRIHDKTWTKLIRNCLLLKHLWLHVVGLPKMYLSDFPKTLQRLALDNIELGYAPEVTFNLKQLSLCSCKLGDEIIENFDNIFNTEKFAIRCGNNSPAQIHTLLEKVIKTQVQYILMEKFPFIDANSNTKVVKFLEKCNILYPQKNFILEKLDNSWTGRETTFREMQIIWYNLFDLERFFTLESRKAWIKFELDKLSVT